MNPLKKILIFASIISIIIFYDTNAQIIKISTSPFRVSSGETVTINFNLPDNNNGAINAVLLQPLIGTIPLKLQKQNNSNYTAEFQINENSQAGLYAITAWIGDSIKPSAVGKGSFLYKKIIGDFCYPRIFDSEAAQQELKNYFNEFKSFGGNFIIAHGLITPQKAYYASSIANTKDSVNFNKDILETLLQHTDKEGVAVMFSTSWDMTNNISYENRTASTKKIMEELYQLYKHHPSMVGFYPYQEGSGTYFQPFVKEFCGYAKSLNPGLLTAVAPYMDDPLLAGYLSTVDDLDIIIYQSMVMASYRPDNRKKFPFRRVKDFSSVGVGAKQLQNKISLTHVELFGYGENKLKDLYITKYNNIYQQILSAATVPDNDGITLFNYSNIMYELLKKYPEFKNSRQAVFDGIKAFQLIGKASQNLNQLSVYFPWADWAIDRWANNYYDALDAFRTLGVPVNVLPYAPPFEEAELPYYPYHENPEVLKRLLTEKKILVFPNVSGFYQTDSDMIKHFIESGGVVIAFGPQIPMGTTYNRSEIFGIEESGMKIQNKIINKNKSGRVSANKEWKFEAIEIPIWKSTGGEVLAEFEDGTPAVSINKFGDGFSIAVFTDALTAAENFPGLVRDVIDIAFEKINLKRSLDITGLNKNTDIALSEDEGSLTAAIVNHNDEDINVILTPLQEKYLSGSIEYVDLLNNKTKVEKNNFIEISVPAQSFRVLEIKK